MVTRRWFLACLAVTGLVDCSKPAVPVAVDVADSVGDAIDVADSADTDVVIKDIDGSISDGSDGNLCPNGVIQIDFPCYPDRACSGATTWVGNKTVTCADLGYAPGCCNGLSCQPNATSGVCPEGQFCSPGPAFDDLCVTPDCSGNSDCKDGYCLKPPGACNDSAAKGVCVGNDNTCGNPQGNADHKLYCGCDGEAHTGLCDIVAAKTSIAAEGPCCKADKIGFLQGNPLGFTQWETCLTYKSSEYVPQNAKCQPADANSLCGAGETSCVGDLASAGTVTDAEWAMLCQIAGAPYITRVGGRGGVACGGAPSAPVMCASGCADPCGCKSCVSAYLPGCSTDTTAIVQCVGQCLEATPCGPGLACTGQGAGLTCGGACADVWSAVQAKLPGWKACTTASDCKMVPLSCGKMTCPIAANPKSSWEMTFWNTGLHENWCKTDACTCSGSGFGLNCTCNGAYDSVVDCIGGNCTVK